MTKLEKYLANYIEHEHDLNSKICLAFSYPDGAVKIDTDTLQEIIRQGLFAFQSTESSDIMILPHNPDIPAFYWDK